MPGADRGGAQTLDPIVSLSVAMAESPGSYAFLLGAGVSRDAQVPTGVEVFWLAVGALYRLENDVDETPDTEELARWLDETGRSDLTYSDVLELLAPGEEDRRSYLASFFEGREPAETHRRLAALASEGLVRVLVTTNFDRLLEQALAEAGVTPVVITRGSDLAVAPAREHTACYVVKAHGDYLQQTIRNTEQELAELDRELTDELQTIFNRYGLVVLGYSGSDPAIGQCLKARRSRYGMYWLHRAAELSAPAHVILEANAGRVIVRPDAASFLSDLERRLGVYRAHPSGDTPELVNASVVTLLRTRDEVGLRELLKGHRREILETAARMAAERRHSNGPTDTADFADEVLPTIHAHLAAVYPLIEHGSPAWEDEVRALAVLAGERLGDSGLVAWLELCTWVAWYITNAAGGFAVAVDNLDACHSLLIAPVQSRHSDTETLATLRAGESGVNVGRALMGRVDDTRWASPHFEHLLRALHEEDFLRRRYPEFARDREQLLVNLTGFNLLATLFAARQDTVVEGIWTMYHEGGVRMLTRIMGDTTVQSKVTEMLGMTPEDLRGQAGGLLDRGAFKPAGRDVSDIDLVLRRA